MTDRRYRKLAAIGTTRVVDGVTFTASPFVLDGEVRPSHILWDGGARGGIIREGATKTTMVTRGWDREETALEIPRFYWNNQARNTFLPLARMAIANQRRAYEQAKVLVDAFEAALPS